VKYNVSIVAMKVKKVILKLANVNVSVVMMWYKLIREKIKKTHKKRR